mgnify:FL=1
MRKLVFFISVLTLFSTTKHYGQSLYKREWGILLPISTKTTKPFSPNKTIVRTVTFVTEVNPITGNLYIVNAEGNEIYEYRQDELRPKLIFKISEEEKSLTTIESLKFDFENNLIILGRTVAQNLATPGAYSESLIFGFKLAPSFLAKINLQGSVIWSTYFHDILSNNSPLAIDSENNIYILNKRNKNTVASPTFFQKNGDLTSNIEYQDVISKLDKNGKHIWSTFYTKDNSCIRSIAAGDNGLFIYGDHMGATMSSNYFGTSNSHHETVYRPNTSQDNVFSVFLSKFSFNGERLWSTYFGEENTNVTLGSTLLNNNSLTVIGDNAYILATHRIFNKNVKITTEKAYLKEPFIEVGSTSVSKFSTTGERIWTSFVHAGEYIFSNDDELFITSSILNKNNENNLPTINAYQPKYGGGNSDVYTSVVSLDGTKLNYASFYGYEGTDAGVTLPTKAGFYIIGTSDVNSKPKSPFATSHSSEKKYFQNGDVYSGDFLSYFKQNTKVKHKKKKNDQ